MDFWMISCKIQSVTSRADNLVINSNSDFSRGLFAEFVQSGFNTMHADTLCSGTLLRKSAQKQGDIT